MKKFLAVTLTVVFGVASYFLGNYLLGTFDEPLFHRIITTSLGLAIIWFISRFFVAVYNIILDFLNGE